MADNTLFIAGIRMSSDYEQGFVCVIPDNQMKQVICITHYQ
jgi:hypothetical protein